MGYVFKEICDRNPNVIIKTIRNCYVGKDSLLNLAEEADKGKKIQLDRMEIAVDYIRKNSKWFFNEYCVDDEACLRFAINNNLLPSKDINNLIMAVKNENIKDILIGLQNELNSDINVQNNPDISQEFKPIDPVYPLKNLRFVVTGDLVNFPEFTLHPTREKLKEFIESRGGKLTGSVSGKTDYLICNDNSSVTTKALDAQKRGIPIIDEEKFLKMSGGLN